jgi:hypothetical protein
MSRFIFAVAVCLSLSPAATAQRVPGRDLLEFPLGTMAESPALSRQIAGGLWNPAAGTLDGANRAQVGFAALTTPYEQGVESKLVSGAFRVRPTVTATLSFAQASINDVFKTETDPQSIGEAIPYSTMVLSLGGARQFRRASMGAALRYRWGSLDTSRAGAVSLDAGVMIDRVFGTPVRVAASTFLLSPSRADESATYLAGADFPLVPFDSVWSLRGGASVQHTDRRGREDYLFMTARYLGVDASIGLSQSNVFGNVNRRLRLGLGLHYARYGVAVAREEGGAGIGASNQFLLTSVFR